MSALLFAYPYLTYMHFLLTSITITLLFPEIWISFSAGVMASGVPSFIKQSVKYEDICSDEEAEPVQATPLARVPPSTSNPEKSSNSSKRKLPSIPSDSARTLGSRPLKKTRGPSPQGEAGPHSRLQKFYEMLRNQVPEETLSQWDRVSMVEAAPVVTLANAQSLFFYLKYGEQIIETVRGDQRLVEEVRQLKATLKSREEEQRRAGETIRKIRASEAKILKERDQLSQAILKLDKDKEDEAATAAKKARELGLKIENLQAALKGNKSTLLEAKKAKYEAGYKNGINDYMRSTIEAFPDLDWSKLGGDAATMAGEIQRKKAGEAPPPPKMSELVVAEVEVRAAQEEGEVQKDEPQCTDSTPAVATDEAASKTPTP